MKMTVFRSLLSPNRLFAAPLTIHNSRFSFLGSRLSFSQNYPTTKLPNYKTTKLQN